MCPGSIPKRPAARRLSTLGLALLVLSSQFWAPFARGEGEPSPRAPTQREIDGYRAALQDPNDTVVAAARDYKRADLILPRLGTLPDDLAERVVGIWLAWTREEVFRALALHDGLAAVAEDRIAVLLATDRPERCGSAAFFVKRPGKAAGHKRALTECLVVVARVP